MRFKLCGAKPIVVLSLLSVFLLAPSFSGPARDRPEPGSSERIAELTSDPKYLSPWVSYVPDSSTVPSPK